MDMSTGHGWSCSMSCLSYTFNHACFAPPKLCLLCTSNVTLVLHLQCHACCALSIPCTCYALSMLCLFCTWRHHACFAPSISCLFCICNVAIVMHIPVSCFFCTFNVVLILQRLVWNFDIQQWWATRSLACPESLFITISPLKVIIFSNINGTLRNVHFNNREMMMVMMNVAEKVFISDLCWEEAWASEMNLCCRQLNVAGIFLLGIIQCHECHQLWVLQHSVSNIWSCFEDKNPSIRRFCLGTPEKEIVAKSENINFGATRKS